MPPSERAEIVIVGSRASGLSAAGALKHLGHQAVALEQEVTMASKVPPGTERRSTMFSRFPTQLRTMAAHDFAQVARRLSLVSTSSGTTRPLAVCSLNRTVTHGSWRRWCHGTCVHETEPRA